MRGLSSMSTGEWKANMTHLLEFRNVSKIFSRGIVHKDVTVAVDDVSFSIEAEDPGIISLAGESGSGKTTLGLMVLGFLKTTEGDVLYKGNNVAHLPKQEKKNFRREVQAVFQDPFAVYNPFYRVDHLMDVPMKKFNLAASKTEGQELIEKALNTVGLRPQEILGRFPHQLSGGQRQRLVVARALLLQPQLLVADEPVSMVDASLRATILKSLNSLNRDFGIPILYITHDLTTAYHISDYIIILYLGSVMEAGDVDSVIKNPQHPYTQLLVDSIPWPDLQRKWGEQELIVPENGGGAPKAGCKFAPRCPHVMSECRQHIPSFYQVSASRVAACHLYKDAAMMPKKDLGTLFTTKPPSQPSGN